MNTLRGVFLVTFSMAAFSVEDALVKHLTESLAVGQVLFSVGLGGAAIYLVLALRAGHRNPLAVLADRAVLVRTLSEMVSTVTFVTALSLVPLSTVAAVFQATPLAVTAGAALFLGEVVGWRRWTAISVGFAGVLMIIRPGFAGFQPASMLVLVTVAAIALRDLVTRRVPAHIPSLLVAFHGFSALVAAGALLLALGQPARMPAPGDWLGLAAAIGFAAAGYYAIVAAMRLADASALMPFRYARLVFSLILGVAIFAERPDALTLAGAAVILAAAFYSYRRERRLARAAAAAPGPA